MLETPGDRAVVSHRRCWSGAGRTGSVPRANRAVALKTREAESSVGMGEAATRMARREADKRFEVFMVKVRSEGNLLLFWLMGRLNLGNREVLACQ